MDFNFNDPVEITEIFRVQKPIFKTKEEKLFDDNSDEDEDDEEGFIGLAPQIEKMEINEYSSKTAILWEDIRMIKQYTYPDDWKFLKGEKYWISMYSYGQDLLVLGSYKSMYMLWKEFRNAYPPFQP